METLMWQIIGLTTLVLFILACIALIANVVLLFILPGIAKYRIPGRWVWALGVLLTVLAILPATLVAFLRSIGHSFVPSAYEALPYYVLLDGLFVVMILMAVVLWRRHNTDYYSSKIKDA